MTMPVLDILDVQTTFARLVEEAACGREVIIARSGKPIARLTPFTAPAQPKKLGLLNGKTDVGNDFNAPLDGEVSSTFEG
jgi:antitoxin (DNA-binding transcriptional repressor) of toxin-antitoxin stability system